MNDGRTPGWVRVGVGALALPQLVTGLWATISPAGWYARFPGFDPRLVAADGPFNAHLASDAGAGFLATGVVLVLAAVWGHRAVVTTALVAYIAFAFPHLAYHATNPAPALTATQDVVNVASLTAAAIAPLVLAWANIRDVHIRPRPQRPKD